MKLALLAILALTSCAPPQVQDPMMTDAYWSQWQEANISRYTDPSYQDAYMRQQNEARGVYDERLLDGLAEAELYLRRKP